MAGGNGPPRALAGGYLFDDERLSARRSDRSPTGQVGLLAVDRGVVGDLVLLAEALDVGSRGGRLLGSRLRDLEPDLGLAPQREDPVERLRRDLECHLELHLAPAEREARVVGRTLGEVAEGWRTDRHGLLRLFEAPQLVDDLDQLIRGRANSPRFGIALASNGPSMATPICRGKEGYGGNGTPGSAERTLQSRLVTGPRHKGRQW
jgi:hypothetical protein